jgi:hypothetical protein
MILGVRNSMLLTAIRTAPHLKPVNMNMLVISKIQLSFDAKDSFVLVAIHVRTHEVRIGAGFTSCCHRSVLLYPMAS